MTARAIAAIAAALLPLLAGCAPLPAPATSAAPPAAKPAHASTTAAAKPAGTTSARYVPPDSTTPSPQAFQVLGTIPEPLSPGERVPPPEKPEVGGADVPVPAPTAPLGESRPDSSAAGVAPAASAAAGAAAATGAAAAPGATSSPGAATSPSAGATPPPVAAPAVGAAPSSAANDTCWRVQVLAPLDSREAEQAKEMASSLLLTPMVVEKDQGRFKVRTKDCLSRSGADQMRRRAVESGFGQAFRISAIKR